MREVLVAVGAVALFAALEAAYYAVRFVTDRRATELRRRLRIGAGAELDADLLRRGRMGRAPWAKALVEALPGAHALERLLEQSDSPWTVAQLLAISLGAGLGGFSLAASLKTALAVALLLGAIATAVPTLLVMSRRERRSRKLSEQLPEALDMMARSLRAGHALSAAFQVVSGEMPEPVSVEFARAFEEQRLGLTLEQAVLAMSRRSPSNSDLKIFAVSAVVQRETGGNLAEILTKIADTIRQRYRFQGKLRALTAEGRASAMVLGSLPVVVSVLVSIMNPGYLGTLVSSPRGPWVIGYACSTWLVGVVWLSKLTKVDL